MSEVDPEISGGYARRVMPVDQSPERFVWGGASVISATSAIEQITEMITGNNDPTLLNIYTATSAVAISALTAYSARNAIRETSAFKTASEEERYAPDTLKKRMHVRLMRTLAWGASNVFMSEAAVGGAFRLAEGRTELLGAALIAGAAGGFMKTLPGFKESIKEYRELRSEGKSPALNPSEQK